MLSIAYGIPTGGGKSVLAKLHPQMFVDHGSQIDVRLLGIIAGSGKRNCLKKAGFYLRSLRFDETKILLTWGPDACPSTHRYMGTLLLTKDFDVQERAMLRKMRDWLNGRGTWYFDDFESRNGFLIENGHVLLPKLRAKLERRKTMIADAEARERERERIELESGIGVCPITRCECNDDDCGRCVEAAITVPLAIAMICMMCS
jgi:hypothetical protein